MHKKSLLNILVFVCAFVTAFVSWPVFAHTFILSAPPRETLQAGQALYGPLAKGLSKLWGVHVKYVHPANWVSYKHAMKAGRYDVVFDGPQFIDWRVANLGDKPILKLPGTIGFSLVVHANDKAIKSTQDLVGKTICVLPPPNLTILTAFSLFTNPARQPNFRWVRGGMPKLYAAFAGDKCAAGIFRSSYFKHKLTSAQRSIARVIYASIPMANQGITVSRRIGKWRARQFVRWMTTTAGKDAVKGVVRRFGGHAGKKAAEFVSANSADYFGDDAVLVNTMYGWPK